MRLQHENRLEPDVPRYTELPMKFSGGPRFPGMLFASRGATTMNMRLAILAAMAFALATGPARAEKPLKDYSFIRGVNYGMTADQAILERDLGYAKRLNLNSTRIWLNVGGYERDPQGYITDRKSTRLNSSHLGISYAVFC